MIARLGIFLPLLLLCGAASIAAPQQDSAAEVVRLTNIERARQKRPPLTANRLLMRAAQIHAEQMVRANRLAHELRGAEYPRPADRLSAAGSDWQAWSENIATGQPTPDAVVESWMKSRGHRRNILDPSMTEIGVGVATDRTGRAWWVQVFARPNQR